MWCKTKKKKLPLTLSWWNKVFGPLKAMLLHPASPLCVQTVIKGAGAQLSARLKVPSRHFQLIEQR